MTNSINTIINPASIAVIGASNRPGSFGAAVTANIMNSGYKGTVYAVNPNTDIVQCNRSYAAVSEIPDDVDLAVIIVPAKEVPGVLEDAGKKNIKGAIIISAGFRETGTEAGAALEDRIKSIGRQYGVRLFGPNCPGAINTCPEVSLNASVSARMPKPGNITFISQSGTLCMAVLDYAAGRNIGFSKFFGFGNKADINEADLLDYLKDDPDTRVILMYLEDITNGHEFLEIARDVVWGRKKPVLAVKSGHTGDTSRAAQTLTGLLVRSDNAYDALFRQSGIIRVEGVNELFNYAAALSQQPVPTGDRVAIITNAGGPGTMAVDAALRHDLKIAPLTGNTKKKLKEILPENASVNNPVDLIGDATHERYEAAMRLAMKDETVDAAVVILTPQAMTDVLQTAEIIPRVKADTDKPVLCCFMGIVDVSRGAAYLREHGIPNYVFPEAAVRSLAAMVRFGELLNRKNRRMRTVTADRDRAANIIRRSMAGGTECIMAKHEVDALLACYGFPLLKTITVTDSAGLKEACAESGFPIVMKAVSPDIINLYEAGGVILKIGSLAEAEAAWAEITGKFRNETDLPEIKGVLIQKMVKKGLDLILGAWRDPKFGPVCMFGLGGLYADALRDVSFRLSPMWEASAEHIIKDIHAYRLLQGIRGRQSSDTESVKDCILRLSQLTSDHPEISELDINPLIVYPRGEGCLAADCRIVLRNTEGTRA